MAHPGHGHGHIDAQFVAQHETHSWPSANKATKKKYKSCDRSGCDDSCSYFCSHCNSYYCYTHEDNHKYMMTSCVGIKLGWVIDLDSIARGGKRCERHYTVSHHGTSKSIHCPRLSKYYCSHCQSYYCDDHDDNHTKNLTKCKGIKKGQVKSL